MRNNPFHLRCHLVYFIDFACKKENALIGLKKEYQVIQRMFANEICAEQLAVNANYYEEALYFEIIQKSSISHANKNANKNEVWVSK